MSSGKTALPSFKIACEACNSVYMRHYEPSDCEYCGNSGLRINDDSTVTRWKTSGVTYVDPAKPFDLSSLLVDRAKTHGNYHDHADCTQKLKDIMRDTVRWPTLDVRQRETLDMVAHKIGRVLAGNSNHLDHWDDIMGYTKLVADALRSGEISST